jgi:hypothetical protein
MGAEWRRDTGFFREWATIQGELTIRLARRDRAPPRSRHDRSTVSARLSRARRRASARATASGAVGQWFESTGAH